MSKRLMFVLVLVCLIGAAWYGTALIGGQAAQSAGAAEEEKAIRATVEQYVNAFNTADAKALAGALAPEAEFVDDEGNAVRGRAEIEKVFAKFLEDNKSAKLQVTMGDVRLVAPNVALEDGESVVTVPDKQEQSARRYSMVFVKQDNKWLLASIREFPDAGDEPVDAQEVLKDLDWLVGEWLDESGESVLETACRWSDDKKHLVRHFAVKVQGKDAVKGTQRIGVDPLTGTIKGWVFDSDGGYGESSWFKNGGGEWLIKATGVSSEGEPGSATYLMKPLDKDKVSLKAMHRVTGDQVEPDIELTMVRKPPQPK
jgi:uncharacterized protein (TIGR02246 family)